MKDWILNKIIEKKNKENTNEMKKFNELVDTEFGKEMLNANITKSNNHK